MHVDGFRFGLTVTLACELHELNKLGASFDVVCQDPVLSQVKLIVGPWNLEEMGCQVGSLPVGWAEWNGWRRDAVRRFWTAQDATLLELTTHGRPPGGHEITDISRRDADGKEMGDAAWNSLPLRSVGGQPAGDINNGVDEKGTVFVGVPLLILLSGANVPRIFKLLAAKQGQRWKCELGTALNGLPKPNGPLSRKAAVIRCRNARWPSFEP